MGKAVLLVFVLSIALSSCANKKKKVSEETETSAPGPAILAIEIVDGSDNSTEVRNNTKRTIESALGYGFQGNYYTTRGKKYMIYPYSQHDIPGNTNINDQQYLSNQLLNVQKSLSYSAGSTVEPATAKTLFTPVSQGPKYTSQPSSYYPSTLFSTVGQGGQIGSLSTNVPTQTHTSTIPVIILRVYSNQLAEPAIYPNLPQSHPYANNLNTINLQSILANYLQHQLYLGQNMYQQSYYQPKLVYQSHQPQDVGYQSQNLGYQGLYQGQNLGYQLYQGQQGYQSPAIDLKALEESAADLPTHENYPDDAHTRVIYHGPKGHIQGLAYTSNTQGYAESQPSQTHTYVPSAQMAYTAANGQKYIYVNPNQVDQNQVYYQQTGNYQQADYQGDYQQQSGEQYPTSYQEQTDNTQSPNAYLPTQSTPQKDYNYQSGSGNNRKERSKKNSVGPVQFQNKQVEEISRSI